jgi:hypothetical protein
MKSVVAAFVTLLTACAVPATRRAVEPEPLPPLVAETQPTSAASAWLEDGFHALAGFTAGRGGDGVTLGANYEYQLKDEIGVGGFGEVTLSNRTAVVLGGAAFFHVGDRWVFLGGPGVEIISGNADVIARVGGWYEFEVDDFTLAPTLFIDLGGGDPAIVVGVSFGF